jgi:hypothetical protein
MASKRPPIEVAEISQNLRDSRGQGMNAFFSQPAPTTPETEVKKAPDPRNHGTVVPGDRGTTVPVVKREIARRHPFDVYADQLHALKKLSMEEKLAGQLGSESAMVREAIDAYIEKRRKK